MMIDPPSRSSFFEGGEINRSAGLRLLKLRKEEKRVMQTIRVMALGTGRQIFITSRAKGRLIGFWP